MSLELIQGHLKSTMGLDAPSIGTASLERAVRARIAACRLTDADEYWQLLAASTVELQELIEAVVVNETWFFRDREAFTALMRVAQQRWLRDESDRVLRILSIPCSTGEEPYSIAMALLEAGVPPHRFQVEGVDISLRAITLAQRAEYGKNSFRGDALGFRERHFTLSGRAYVPSEAVRRQVRFRQGNLFASDSVAQPQSYDAVFCRNLLIYFDRPDQVRAVATLGNLLRPQGMLFVGPSESSLLLDNGFVSARMPMAFAFVRQTERPYGADRPAPMRASAQRIVRRGPSLPPRPRDADRNAGRAAPLARPLNGPAAATPSAVAPGEAAKPTLIEEAQRFADEGNLDEAMRCCERHVRGDPTSAAAFYLMGVLHDAAGRTEKACEHYRKALYLEPSHRDALVHLAVALSRKGDTGGAERLFERARRAGERA